MNYADFNVNQVRQKLPQNEFHNRRLTHLKVSTTPGEPLGLDSGKKHRWDEPEVPPFSFSGTAKSHIGSFARAARLQSVAVTTAPIWSVFQDFGPDPDFFQEIGPEMVQIDTQKSGFG